MHFSISGVCTFARGHVSGAQENIGMSNSADECGVKARRKRPRANGATWSSDGTKWCYAHVGPVSFIAGTEGREGCLYQGNYIALELNVVKFCE